MKTVIVMREELSPKYVTKGTVVVSAKRATVEQDVTNVSMVTTDIQIADHVIVALLVLPQ